VQLVVALFRSLAMNDLVQIFSVEKLKKFGCNDKIISVEVNLTDFIMLFQQDNIKFTKST
jgi:hypothetical protein